MRIRTEIAKEIEKEIATGTTIAIRGTAAGPQSESTTGRSRRGTTRRAGIHETTRETTIGTEIMAEIMIGIETMIGA